MATTETLNKDLKYIIDIYKKLINILPSFDITSKDILPYGLKPHTRSVSWLVEQVITQQSKFHAKDLNIDDVDFDLPDTCLHDCIIKTPQKNYYINIKAHNVDGKNNKNDIAAVEKIYMQYTTNPNYDIIYVCIGIRFDNINISFDPKYLHVFTAQFLPIYVNPRNDKIQATYNHTPIMRSRKDFLNELRNKSKSITLG
jgi:hypothetical protein